MIDILKICLISNRFLLTISLIGLGTFRSLLVTSSWTLPILETFVLGKDCLFTWFILVVAFKLPALPGFGRLGIWVGILFF